MQPMLPIGALVFEIGKSSVKWKFGKLVEIHEGSDREENEEKNINEVNASSGPKLLKTSRDRWKLSGIKVTKFFL